MSDELLPCPFCGAPGYLVKGNTAGFRVKCTNTECTAQSQLTEVSRDAVQRWNRRAAPAAVEPAIARDFGEFDRERTRAHEQSAAEPDFNSLRAPIPAEWVNAYNKRQGDPKRVTKPMEFDGYVPPATTPTAEEVEQRIAYLREQHPDMPRGFQRDAVSADLIERLAAAQREQVPREPDDIMLRAGQREIGSDRPRRVWMAMYDAWHAPSADTAREQKIARLLAEVYKIIEEGFSNDGHVLLRAGDFGGLVAAYNAVDNEHYRALATPSSDSKGRKP